MVLPGNEVALSCNALEYFLLLFSYYIIHPRTLQQSSQWSGVEDVLYVRLLEDYLNFFFPVDGNKNVGVALSPDRKYGSSGTSSSSANLWKSPGTGVNNEPSGRYLEPSGPKMFL